MCTEARDKKLLDCISRLDINLTFNCLLPYFNRSNFRVVEGHGSLKKVYIRSSIWSVHIEQRPTKSLKKGILYELRKILVKEKLIA